MMARRPRSLNELPGHLRVPILKRKDTERTQARLEAGLAGMEELRVLREKQQQLVGDTMAASVGHRHRLQRRHSDFSLLTSGSSKVSRSSGPTPGSFHGSVSSWQSASSLASISEEVDSGASRDVDKNNNCNKIVTKRDNQTTKTSGHRRNNSDDNSQAHVERLSPRNQTKEADVHRCNPLDNGLDHTSQSVCSQQRRRLQMDGQRSWWSQEDLRHKTTNNDNAQSPAKLQNSFSHRDMKGRRMSASSVVNGERHRPSSVSVSRRYSTSAVNYLQSQQNLFLLKEQMASRSPSRSPLSSISNFPESSKEDRNEASPDRQISWDNLLKSIGISSSTSSLSLPDEDENIDVFCTSPNQDNSSDINSRPEKVSLSKIGRSFSFSYGNPMEYAKNNPFFFRQVGLSNRNGSVDGIPEQNACSSPCDVRPDKCFRPIMRRASMQCEAVLTHSDMAKRVLNPIQDVDMNNLMSPGPVHAVMLQYTSREVSTTPNVIKSSTISTESSNKTNLIKAVATERTADLNNSNTKINTQCENNNDHHSIINDSGNFSMDTSSIPENNDSETKYSRHFDSHHPSDNTEDSYDNNSQLNSTSSNSVQKDRRNNNSMGNVNALCTSTAHPLAKMPSIPNARAQQGSSPSVNKVNESLKSPEMKEMSKSRDNQEQTHGMQDRNSTCHSGFKNANDPCSRNTSNLHLMPGTSPSEQNRHSAKTSKVDSTKCLPTEDRELSTDGGNDAYNHTDAKTLNPSIQMAKRPTQSKAEAKDNHCASSITTHSSDDVSKLRFSVTSSDVSLISDEGYSTCDSVGPFSKIILTSSKSIPPVVNENSSEPIEVSEQKHYGGFAKCSPDMKQRETSTQVIEHPNRQTIPEEKDFKYKRVAKLEQGMSIVWNPECSNKAKKSLRHSAIRSKSFKQTAV